MIVIGRCKCGDQYPVDQQGFCFSCGKERSIIPVMERVASIRNHPIMKEEGEKKYFVPSIFGPVFFKSLDEAKMMIEKYIYEECTCSTCNSCQTQMSYIEDKFYS